MSEKYIFIIMGNTLVIVNFINTLAFKTLV